MDMLILRNFIRNHATAGFHKSLRNVKDEWRILRIHRRNLKLAVDFAVMDNLRLHLGCGNRIKSKWVNIDLFSSAADLNLDLREPLPFRTDSVSVIYSEHFLEHLVYPEEVSKFLSECIRILKPKGLFSVGVPDTESCCRNYLNKNEEAFRIAREKGWHPQRCNTLMHQVNYHFRQGEEHQYAYDFQTLAQVLAEAGFENICRRQWSAEYDSPQWEVEGTLYADAYKPV